jgi:hypothetical protein
MNLFLKMAGVDPQLIESNPVDEMKYNRLGLVVFIIMLLATIFSIYALIYVLMPLSSQSSDNTLNYVVALCIGGLWTFIVFNFYQLVISSTGIGEGTVNLTLTELIPLIPKLIMAIMMAMVIAVPMTVWLLQSEIKDTISTPQLNAIAAFNANLDQHYAEDLESLYFKQVMLAEKTESLTIRLAEMKKMAKLHPVKGEEKSIAEMQSELDLGVSNVKQLQANILAVRERIALAKKKNAVIVANSRSLFSDFDKVLGQHKFSFVLISALLLLIHMFPILIRAIWNKGLYEYKVELQNLIVLKKYGIVSKWRLVENEWIDRFTIPEKMLSYVKSKHIKSRRNNDEKLTAWHAEEAIALQKP